MDCFDCIFMSTPRKIQPILYQFTHWFHDLFYFLQHCSKSTKSMKPNGNISAKWAKVLYFVWEKVLFYTKVLVLQQHFRKRFSNFRSIIGLITLLYARLRCYKVFQLLEKLFLIWHFIDNFHNFRVISMFQGI